MKKIRPNEEDLTTQQRSSAEEIIDKMMPSAWATYKQSLASSTLGFVRVMFAFNGVDQEGVKVNRSGILTSIVMESVNVIASLLKLFTAVLMLPVAVAIFLLSPLVNLVALPFYRRKSKIELTKFIAEQEAEISTKIKKAERALGGSA